MSSLSDVEKSESARLAFAEKQAVLKRYRRIAAESGAFIGALIGIVSGGLTFRAWESPYQTWAIVTLGLTGLGTIVGYYFYEIFMGTQASGTAGSSYSGGESGGDGGD